MIGTRSSRTQMAVAYVLAIGAVLVTIAAGAVLVTNFTGGTAPFVRAVVFGLVPALSALAVALAATASQRNFHVSWAAILVGLIGIGLACIAHQLWYLQMDAQSADSGPLLLLMFTGAVVSCGAAIAIILVPVLGRSSLRGPGGVALAIMAGLFGGAIFVASLAMPFTSVLLSVTALVIVVGLHRSERRVSAAPIATGP